MSKKEINETAKKEPASKKPAEQAHTVLSEPYFEDGELKYKETVIE